MRRITVRMTYLDGRIEEQSVPVACSADELVNMLMETVPMIANVEFIKEGPA
tara:strand:+ start:546 stop:701 length:156 start_codon:yes stop_codon:yes gene_type:complete